MTTIYMYAIGGPFYPSETLDKTFLKQTPCCGGGTGEIPPNPKKQHSHPPGRKLFAFYKMDTGWQHIITATL